MTESFRPARRLSPLLLAALLMPTPAPATLWDPLEQAAGLTPQRVLVKKKPRVYFRATDRAPIEFTVPGPARIRIVTRAESPPGGARSVTYAVRVTESRRELKVHSTESGPAPDARLADGPGVVLCKSRSFVLSVPDGPHHVSISVTGVPAVYARILVAAPERGDEAMISITPFEASRSVTVSEGERLIPYYSVLPGKPVKLRIVGPTRLELSARLDYDSTMRGEQRYAFRITSGGQPLREVRFRTTKALTASYTDLKSRVPSKVDRVVLPLGPGLHEINVALVEPRSAGAEIRVRIPQPTAGSDE